MPATIPARVEVEQPPLPAPEIVIRLTIEEATLLRDHLSIYEGSPDMPAHFYVHKEGAQVYGGWLCDAIGAALSQVRRGIDINALA